MPGKSSKDRKTRVLTLTRPVTSSVTSQIKFCNIFRNFKPKAIKCRFRIQNRPRSLADSRGKGGKSHPPAPSGRMSGNTPSGRGLMILRIFPAYLETEDGCIQLPTSYFVSRGAIRKSSRGDRPKRATLLPSGRSAGRAPPVPNVSQGAFRRNLREVWPTAPSMNELRAPRSDTNHKYKAQRTH